MPKRLIHVSDDKVFLIWEQYLSQYLRDKKSKGCSKRTIDDTQYYIHQLFWGINVDFSSLDSLKQNVLDYFDENDHLAPATYNTHLKYFKTFFNWLVTEEVLAKNPIDDIKLRKVQFNPKYLSSEEISKLLDKCDRTTYVGLRDYICIALSYDTGLSPSELQQILYSDINLKAHQITIRSEVSKNDISRVIPLNQKLAPLVKKLYQLRIEQDWPDNIPMFANWNGTKMTRWSWRRRLIEYSTRKIKATPFMLRHSFAITSFQSNATKYHVKTIMGIKSPSIINSYYKIAKGK